tara:strand:+ start:2807 stop:3397 length:591 start_codon:yes stop_codon:yes gene_type:complete
MAKRKINMRQISQKISRSNGFKKAMMQRATDKFKDVKDTLVSNFNNHPITQEIEGGPGGSNVSGTLGGYGNLFSFIGFHNNSDPIAPLRRLINKNLQLLRGPRTRITRNRIYQTYKVAYPDIGEFYKYSPSPWDGRSWIHGVENGLSGFGHYMYGKFNGSRSGTGVQSTSSKRTKSYKAMEYISEILRDFKRDIKT